MKESLWLHFEEGLGEESIEIGKAESKMKAYAEQVLAKVSKGKTPPEIAEALEIDI